MAEWQSIKIGLGLIFRIDTKARILLALSLSRPNWTFLTKIDNLVEVYVKKLVLLSLLALLAVSSVQAVPTLQLYIDGATYDDVTESWVTSASSFDLYVIGKGDLNNVTLSMALQNVGEFDDPAAAAVNIDGTSYPTDSWTYGYAPLSNVASSWDGGDEDLQKHDIYPAWFTEFGLGNFTTQGGIGDVNVDSATAHDDPFWLPTQGYINSEHDGWFQSYHIEISDGYAVHFDAFTLDERGRVDQFNPFSHDATGGGDKIPEPATMLLFGMGLAGAGVIRKLRQRK